MEYENGVIDEVLATEEPNHDKEQFEEMKAMLSELAGSRRHKDDAGDNNEDEEGHRALKTVYNYLHKSGPEARAEFRRYDKDGSGSLEPAELARLLHSALPQLSARQLRYVLGHLQRHDLDGDGCLSYAELCVAMRAVDIKWRKRREDGHMGDEGSEEDEGGSEGGQDVGQQWELQEFSYHGHSLLLDPRTQRVYFLPPAEGEAMEQGGGGAEAEAEAWWGGSWPVVVGKMESDGSVAVAAALPPDALWAALDTHLRDNKMQLQQLYAGYDSDGNGRLDPHELGLLLGELLGGPEGGGGFRPAQLKYAAAMMDANCDGSVSYGEFLAAARDSLKAATALKAELARRPQPPPLPLPPPPPAPQRSAARLSAAPSATSLRSATSSSSRRRQQQQPPAPAAEPSGAGSVRSVRSARSAAPSTSTSAGQQQQQPPSQQPSRRSVAYDEAEDAPASPTAAPPPPAPPLSPPRSEPSAQTSQLPPPPPEEEEAMEEEEFAAMQEDDEGLEGLGEGLDGEEGGSRRPLSPGRRWNRRQAAAATARWLASRAPLPPHSPGSLPPLQPPLQGMATLRAKLHTGHRFPVSAVAFAPSCHLLASASRDVRLYDVRSGRLRVVLDGHGGLVRCLAFSPDGRQLCSGGDDAVVLVWNLEACLALSRPGQVATLTPPGFPSSTNPSAGAPVAPSGMPLATTTTATAGTASGTPRSSSALGSSSGGGLGSSSGGGGGSFHPMQRVVSKALRRHHKPVLAMAATADSKYLVTGGADRTVRVWDTGSGYCLATLRGHHGDVTSLAVSSSGKHIFSGGSDRLVFVWDFNTGECVRQLKGHKGAVSTISLAPDGQWLVTGGHDKALRVWDASNGTELAVLPAHGGAFGVVSSALSPCGALIASGGYDHLVKLWDANSGLAVATLEGHRHMVSSLAFSPDGSLLATAGRDDEVRLWDCNTRYPYLSPATGGTAGGGTSTSTSRRPRTAGGASSGGGGGGAGLYTTMSVGAAGSNDGSPNGTGAGRGGVADAPVPRPAEQAFNRHWECLFGARGRAAGKTAAEAAAFATATERGRARAASAGRARPGTAPAGGRRW